MDGQGGPDWARVSQTGPDWARLGLTHMDCHRQAKAGLTGPDPRAANFHREAQPYANFEGQEKARMVRAGGLMVALLW